MVSFEGQIGPQAVHTALCHCTVYPSIAVKASQMRRCVVALKLQVREHPGRRQSVPTINFHKGIPVLCRCFVPFSSSISESPTWTFAHAYRQETLQIRNPDHVCSQARARQRWG